ncbi:MAG TPA: adenylate cyclase, partial [Alphaproteobacteria bacterium]|nr:adenylate cyclase [Alphaproteobacteria bacterium]
DCAFVAVTDVVSSTAAISDGRYKDVNLAGAAGIAAFANSFPDWDLPSAFGGDGAAIILPEDVEREAREVLPGLLNTCRRALGLGMR